MRFMVKAQWNQAPSDEAMALVPAEQARAKELMDTGIVQSVYVAADMSAVWAVWNAESKDDIQKDLETLPQYKFKNFEITPLSE